MSLAFKSVGIPKIIKNPVCYVSSAKEIRYKLGRQKWTHGEMSDDAFHFN